METIPAFPSPLPEGKIALPAGAAAAIVIPPAALTVEHFFHQAAHASGSDLALGDPLPFCRGDRTTNK